MTVSEEALLVYWKEHREQLRQSETQRSTLTNFLLVVTAGLSGFAAQQKFAPSTIPASVLIVMIGIYGALSSAKFHERANYHLGQARALTAQLAAMGALGDEADLDAARTRHKRRFKRLYELRLHRLWTGLHVGVALYGVALIVVALV